MTHIGVVIPWEPGQRLGQACNRAMQHADGWVLILDHDTYLCNPNWYDICQQAITTLGPTAGLLTCVTNRIGCALQRAKHAVRGDDLAEHITAARRQYDEYAATPYVDVTDNREHVLSGFFFLTHKEAWTMAGGFADKFIGMDNAYHRAIVGAGYRVYVMRHLYTYHAYKRFWKDNNVSTWGQS